MDLQLLKRAYDASRELRGHKQEQAAKCVGKSKSMISRVLAGKVTSQPTINRVKSYIYETGMIKTEQELQRFIDSGGTKLANCKH